MPAPRLPHSMPAVALRRAPSALYRALPAWGWVVVSVGIAFALVSAQPLLLTCVWLVVPVLVRLLWRQGEPPLLLLGALMLWLISSAQALYYAGYLGQPLAEVYGGPELERVVWLSLAGTLALALGMRLALTDLPSAPAATLREEVRSFSIRKLFIAYLVSLFAANGLGASAAFGLPRLSQFVFAAYNLRWALFFLLCYAVLARREEQRLLALAIAIEIGMGFMSYWGEFKDFFFFFILAFVAARPRLTLRQSATAGTLTLLIVLLGLFWTAVKPEYRAFLNQGTDTQRVLVSVPERIEKIGTMALEIRARDLSEGVEPLINRVGYVEYFAHAVNYVPRSVPHEDGALWGKAVMHILKPRLFFPNKPAIHDSEVTQRYTGIDVSGYREGTSINLGYPAESYVDFGPRGMLVPIFFVGIFFGLIYRYFSYAHPLIIGFALVCPVLVHSTSQLRSTPKLLGTTIVNAIFMALVLAFAVPYFLEWVRRSR